MEDKDYRIIEDAHYQDTQQKRWRWVMYMLIPLFTYNLYSAITRSETLTAEPDLLIPIAVFSIAILLIAVIGIIFVREDKVLYTIRLTEEKVFIIRKNATM